MQRPLSKCQFVAFGAGVAMIAALFLIPLIPWWIAGNHSLEDRFRCVFSLLSIGVPIGFTYAAARYAGRYDRVAFITPAVPALTYFIAGLLNDIEIPIRAAATHTFIHQIGPALPFGLLAFAIPILWTLFIGGIGLGLNSLINRLSKNSIQQVNGTVPDDQGASFRIFCIRLGGAVVVLLLVYPFYVMAQNTPAARCKQASKELFSPNVAMNRKLQTLSELSRIPGDQSTHVLKRVFKEQPDPLNFMAGVYLAARNDLSGLSLVESQLMDPSFKASRYQLDKNEMLWMIERITDPAAIPTLARLMKSPDPRIRKAAIRALRNTDSEHVIDPLLLALDDSEAEIRWIAAMSLAEIIDRGVNGRNYDWRPSKDEFNKNEQKYINHWNEWARAGKNTFKFISKADIEAAFVYVPPPKPIVFILDRFHGRESVEKYLDNSGTLSIPASIEGLPVISIGKETFARLSSFKRVIFPEGMLRVDAEAFSGCTNITNIVIPSSVTFIGSKAFYRCKNLKSFTVDPQNPIFTSIDGVLFNKNSSVIWQYPAAKSGTNYTIPSTVHTIAISAFAFAKGLTSVTIPSSVTFIGADAFQHCWNLTNMIVPEGVTTVCGGAFEDCSHLSSISIPSSVNKMERTPFNWCRNLSFINIDSNNPSYTVVDQVLFNKNQSRLIQYLETKLDTNYSIPSSVTSIGPSAFALSHHLQRLIIPDGVTNIGCGAFSNCLTLSNVSIPLQIRKLESGVFYNCGFTSLKIPSSVTSIGEEALTSCRNLTSIEIPGSVTNVESGAFCFDKALSNAVFEGNAPKMGQQVFRGTDSNFTVHYQNGATGFTSPIWVDSSKSQWPSIATPSNAAQ